MLDPKAGCQQRLNRQELRFRAGRRPTPAAARLRLTSCVAAGPPDGGLRAAQPASAITTWRCGTPGALADRACLGSSRPGSLAGLVTHSRMSRQVVGTDCGHPGLHSRWSKSIVRQHRLGNNRATAPTMVVLTPHQSSLSSQGSPGAPRSDPAAVQTWRGTPVSRLGALDDEDRHFCPGRSPPWRAERIGCGIETQGYDSTVREASPCEESHADQVRAGEERETVRGAQGHSPVPVRCTQVARRRRWKRGRSGQTTCRCGGLLRARPGRIRPTGRSAPRGRPTTLGAAEGRPSPRSKRRSRHGIPPSPARWLGIDAAVAKQQLALGGRRHLVVVGNDEGGLAFGV